MIWFLSFIVAVVTAVLCMFAAGFIASLCVKWYQITSREGASGYFIVFIGLLALMGGFIIGIVCCAIFPPGSGIAFAKALGLGFAIILLPGGIVAVVCRLLADVPPEIDGEDLFLIVEVQCPATQAYSPASESGDAYLRLGRFGLVGHVLRKHVRGPLWREEARLVDGRWIVRGAVEVFTSRAPRFLEIALSPAPCEGFLVPLPRWPGRAQLEWSEWLPRPRRDGKPSSNHFSYRFRVQRWSEPMKHELVGDFEVATITRSFYEDTDHGNTYFASRDQFRINFRGNPLAVADVGADPTNPSELGSINMVVSFPSPLPAMLINIEKSYDSKAFYLLSEVAGQAKVEVVADSGANNTLLELAPDPKGFAADSRRVGRRVLARGGLFRVGLNGVLDTRTLTVHRFTRVLGFNDRDDIPPLGVSPDERSFVRYGSTTEGNGKPALAVTDFVADHSYTLLIDRQRMHYTKEAQLDIAWLNHHFTWEPDSEGIDRLVERKDFVPLPYCGELDRGYGGTTLYVVDGAGDGMRAAMETFLVDHLKAERLPMKEFAHEHEFRIDGHKVGVSGSADSHSVLVSAEAPAGSNLIATLADQFNAELATGKHDGLFQNT
jgi:hypothetical protein